MGSCSQSCGSNVITDKWIFTHKFLSDGTFDCYKARWVLRGFTQRPVLDYDETFSPIVKPATVRTMLTIGASHNSLIQQLDVKNGFLHDTLNETVYYSHPTGFANPTQPDLVCRLNKSLYGLKQAPWANLTSLGFLEVRLDMSLLILRRGPDTVYLVLYVDDIHEKIGGKKCSLTRAKAPSRRPPPRLGWGGVGWGGRCTLGVSIASTEKNGREIDVDDSGNDGELS
jgi:hypothetical protein